MIIAAAIKQDGAVYSGIPFKERHGGVIRYMVRVVGLPKPIKGEQGFLNHKLEFLTREEAGKEAVRCGQVIVGQAKIRHVFNGKELFSEDVW
jgi:hypothetical protein